MPSAQQIAQQVYNNNNAQQMHVAPAFAPVQFRKAVREDVKLKIILGGISGTGKTWSALQLSAGIGGKTVLLDTEGGSGELYADSFEYDYASITSPYSPENFIHHIDAAMAAGYDTIIIDSLTHEWSGTGGVIDIADNAPQTVYGGWHIATPRHQKFIEILLHKQINIIATCRMKQGYEIVKNRKGKDTPQKTQQLVFVQKEGIEYEFTLGFQLLGDGMAVPLKDRTSLFQGQPTIQLNQAVGEKLARWATSGADHSQEFANHLDKLKTASSIKELKDIFQQGYMIIRIWSDKNYIEEYTKIKNAKKLEIDENATKKSSDSL